jgi:glutaconate CoA-transferase, subunit A
VSKILTVKEAVSTYIKDGSHIAIGGFCPARNPMAIAYEIIRHKIKDLHLYVHSQGQAFDLLIGAGCVKRVELAYGGNGRFASTCIRFAKAVEAGTLEWEDYTNYEMALRFLAGSMSIPFIPTKTSLGSDIVRKEGFRPETRQDKSIASKKLVITNNPFTDSNDKIVLVPAINADIALIHAQKVGDQGTVRIEGLRFADVEIARCAKTLIVSCEKIVPESELRQNPDMNCIPFFMVDAIVEVPHGGHPTNCFNYYDYDAQHLNMYAKMAENDDTFKEYLDRWVYGVSSHKEYIDLVGAERLAEIKADPSFGFKPGLERRE